MDDLTKTTFTSSTALKGPLLGMPVLRIVAHPDLSRWGESCPLPDQSLILSRDFAGFSGRPLADGRISRRHAELTVQGMRLELRDLSSSNGTTLNGQPIRSATLVLGDVIGVGDTFIAVSQDTGEPRQREGGPLLGDSAAMTALRREIAEVASCAATVLVLGETGAGKDLVAREIHRQSRRSGEYLAVNCAALPEALLESELFGHLKGAFSGAETSKIGLFEAANRGTIFLDEIGDMAPTLQTRLLRVLQNREIRPVGATRAKPIDVRVVAATNCDMVEAVIAKRFRADLYSRLSEWVLKLPPLRERREDIPALTRAFAPDRIRQLSSDLVAAFLAHTWPFNVRELQSLVALAAIESERATLQLGPRVLDRLLEHQQIADANPSTRVREGSTRVPLVVAPPSSEATGAPLDLAPPSSEATRLDAPADEAIPATVSAPPTEAELRALLSHFHGNVYKISAHIGKHRYQVYRWARNLGIDVAAYRAEEGD
ncbi:MAG: sigma 54-interacting transcriptional regulator [Myxococcales bacterium]|nr:sigma 54-interacting transcriptional regulator [Myxococcales bacterium]